jgi:hypothetical protein
LQEGFFQIPNKYQQIQNSFRKLKNIMKLRNYSPFRQVKPSQVVRIISLSLFLGTMFQGMSEAVAQFKPRTRKPPSIHSRGGGSRGCPGDNDKIPLTLFAPKSYRGETASKSPTLAWYMPTARPVNFDLYELPLNEKERPKKLGKRQELNAVPGVNKIAIASFYPELTVGKQYLWQISLRCSSGVAFERAEFQVVDIPSAIKGIISSVTNSIQIVNSLAQQGLWYDAFSEAVKQPESGKVGQLGSSLVKELVQSEEPDNVPDQRKYIEEQINQLQLIVQQ